MYKNPENFNKMKGAMFKSFMIENTKCLEPKKEIILKYFHNTVYGDIVDYENQELYIF